MRFEDRLLGELRTVVSDRAAGESAGESAGQATGQATGPARRGGRPRLSVAGTLTGATAAAVVGAVAFVGVGTGPAWSVQREDDGMVRVQVHDWKDPKGLERELEKYVSDAHVQIIPEGKKCTPAWEKSLGDLPRQRMSFELAEPGADGRTLDVSFDPGDVPDGQTLVAVNREGIRMHDDGEWTTISMSGLNLGKGTVGPCDLVPANR